MENFQNIEKEKYKILSNIKSLKDLKNLSYFELEKLCSEIRKKIVYTVSRNGGHLASNLGIVELTVAIHKEFNSPEDKIVWDTGHQGYAHKLITGRFLNFDTLKKKDGVGAFISPFESEHDSFIAGHSSISLSAACGIAKALSLKNSKSTVIAVIGDGALTGGIAYEALNNAYDLKNLIIILNCNDMSISKTVGSFYRYVASIRSNETYVYMRNGFDRFLEKIPLMGKFFKNTLFSSKQALKNMVYKSNFFNELGYSFLNFVDGHNIKEIVKALRWAKATEKPAIVQICTKKGKGYSFSEKRPELYHGVSPFDVKTGVIEKKDNLNFSAVFGKKIVEFAKKDKKICAITAAMGVATGLFEFEKNFKERYFDVGIAEEHAVTFAAGLAKEGMLAVFAVYSTFLQRSYDQLIHDVSILNLHVVLAIDRAGISDEGPTHQGVFDVSFLTTIPNVKIYSPATYKELEVMFEKALYKEEGLVAVRYPKGVEIVENLKYSDEDFSVFGEGEIVLVSYGILFEEVLKAKENLNREGVEICCIKINKIFPIAKSLIEKLKKYKEVFFFEEGMKNGGIGEHLSLELTKSCYEGKFNLKAIDGVFVKQMSRFEALIELKLDSKHIEKEVLKSELIIKNSFLVNEKNKG